MAKDTGDDLVALCEALGVEDPNTVTRVVVDIRPGEFPRLLIERIADARKIVAALGGPSIDLHREDPTDSALREVSDLRAAANSLRVVANDLRRDGPVVDGSVTGGQFAWNNGNVTQSQG